MITNVEQYFVDGCGRCSLFATPKCKVNLWIDQLLLLREIIKSTGLKEEAKWGAPCYTYEDKNILMLSALKNAAVVSFFKGALIEDPSGILVKPGANSQASRMLKFTDSGQIIALKDHLTHFIQQAIELEKSGKKVDFKKEPEILPEELVLKFQENPALEEAFFKLTPGRQRGYLLFFSQAKQSQTRVQRIEKYQNQILQGKGMQD